LPGAWQEKKTLEKGIEIFSRLQRYDKFNENENENENFFALSLPFSKRKSP